MSDDGTYEPTHGDKCRWGVIWTWDVMFQRWCHSSNAMMTHREAVERGAEFGVDDEPADV